jgi:hypothetical protein
MNGRKLLSVLLAAALAATSLSMLALAADDPYYPVEGVEHVAYKTDDDGYVDLSKPVDIIPYGGTVYFPLLNEKYLGGGSSSQQDVNAKQAIVNGLIAEIGQPAGGGAATGLYLARDNAQAALTARQGELNAAASALNAQRSAAQTVKGKADDWKAAKATYDGNLAAYNLLHAEYQSYDAVRAAIAGIATVPEALAAKGVYDDVDDVGALEAAQSSYAAAVTAQGTAQTNYNTELDARIAANATAMAEIEDDLTAYLAIEIAVPDTAASNHWNTVVAAKYETAGGTATDLNALKGYADALRAADKALADAQAAYISAAGASNLGGAEDVFEDVTTVKDIQALLAFNAATDWAILTGWTAADQQAYSDYKPTAEQALVTNAQNAYNSAVSGYNTTYSSAPANQRFTQQANADNAVDNAAAVLGAVGAAYTAADDLADNPSGDSAYSSLLAAYNTANGNLTAKLAQLGNPGDQTAGTAYGDLYLAGQALGSSGYPYVYETASRASNARIKSTWELSKSLVKNVSIVKRRAIGTSAETGYNISNAQSTMRYIYFVAITIEKRSTASDADLHGVISLKRSGTPSYDCELDVSMSIGYEYADDSIIEIDPLLFKEGYGFYGDDEEQFDFECDADSYFIVNTLSQGKIVLAADTKFDYDIAELYPKANLDFFNGNGASFNKIGELYLSADEDSYLYYVKSNGDLGELSKSQYEYDDYEEAFVIKTRTLGRYVISDVKLKLVSTDSGSDSDSDSGSTVIPVTPPTGGGNGNPLTGANL